MLGVAQRGANGIPCVFRVVHRRPPHASFAHDPLCLFLSICIFAGPFRFVDSYGASNLLSRILRYREVYGNHFEPAPLLQDYAKDPSKKFHSK